MRTVICDLSAEDWAKFREMPSDVEIILNNGNMKKCIGCFGCWVKTPGQCVLADQYQKLGELYGKTEELVIISRCSFGGYSSFVKNVMDRSISYVLPYFQIRGGEMHHRPRYKNHMRIRAFFYGEHLTDAEKDTARRLVEANAVNFWARVGQISFAESVEEIREAFTW